MTSIKPELSTIPVEAYALASSTYMPDDTHCFVVTADKKTSWKNGGRGWTEGDSNQLLLSTNVYGAWLYEYIPPDDLAKSGMVFGTTGLCHTYANRELIFSTEEVSVSAAAKDDVCVAFFGKYGLGTTQFKKLLAASYEEVMKTYQDSNHVYNTILARIDNTIEEEFQAWCSVCKAYFGIPVDDILARNPKSGPYIAKKRLQALMDAREALYQTYANKEIPKETYAEKRKALFLSGITEYLAYLCNIRYISEADKNTYQKNAETFLNRLASCIQRQTAQFEQTGHLHMLLALEEE